MIPTPTESIQKHHTNLKCTLYTGGPGTGKSYIIKNMKE